MSLDNIQLPSITIQQLFKHSLVAGAVSQKSAPKTASSSIATLGNNKKNILILVSNDETLYLPDEQLNFLLGILSACSLTMDDVAILNINKNPPVTHKSLTETLNPGKIILFEVTPDQIELPLGFPQYQVQKFSNQTYLSAPSLVTIQNDKPQKALLWNCLKQIFGL